MNTLIKTPSFEIDNDFFEFLGKGQSGHTYRLTENLVGKFPLYPNKEQVKNEKKMCDFAYRKGINVPEPEGIFMLRHPIKDLIMPVFVREYVPGRTLQNIYKANIEEYYRIQPIAVKEIKKASDSRIYVNDTARKNFIWNEEEGRVYLIDFTHWRIK